MQRQLTGVDQEELFLDRLYESLNERIYELLDEKSKDKEAFQKVLQVRAMVILESKMIKINLLVKLKKH